MKIIMKNFANRIRYLIQFLPSFEGFMLAFFSIWILSWAGYSAYNSTTIENIVAILSYGFGITITLFILNGFKYSNYLIIRLTQKFYIVSLVIISIFFVLCLLISNDFYIYNELLHFTQKLIDLIFPTAHYIGLGPDDTFLTSTSSDDIIGNNNAGNSNTSVNVPSNNANNTNLGSLAKTEDGSGYKIEATIPKIVIDGVAKIATNLGADIGSNAAAGALGVAALNMAAKASASLPGVSKVIVPAGVGIITTGLGKAALNTADNLTKNNRIKEALAKQATSSAECIKDNIPNPDDITKFSAGFELNFGFLDNTTPLESLIYTLYFNSLLIFVSLFFILYILFSLYLLKYNINVIDKFIKKYSNNKIVIYFNKIRSFGSLYSERFLKIMLIIFAVQIICLIMLNYYISHELVNNMEDYIKVYNYIKGTKIIIPLICTWNKKLRKSIIISFLILFTLFLVGVLYEVYNFNILYFVYDTLFNPTHIFRKYMYITFTIISFIFILRYIIIIFTIYLVKNQKLKRSIFKPDILNNYIQEYEIICQYEQLNLLIQYYYTHMFLFLFSFVLAISGYIITIVLI